MRKEYKKAKNYRTSYCSTLGTSSIHVFESCRVDPNFANTQAPLLIPGGIEDGENLIEGVHVTTIIIKYFALNNFPLYE
jgi:hypothetical protein